MFATDPDNPLEPTATGNTLPFAANGLFRLPKHMVDETPPREPTLRPSLGMGAGMNAIFAQASGIESVHRQDSVSGVVPVADDEGEDEEKAEDEPQDDSEYDTLIIESPDAYATGGHDAPIGGIRIITGRCHCTIYVYDTIHSAFKEGIDDAITLRKEWLASAAGQSAIPYDGTTKDSKETSKLGAWSLRKKSETNVAVGFAYAIAIVCVYDCPPDCQFVSYNQEQLVAGGYVEDNYGIGAESNTPKMSTERRLKGSAQRCYRVFVDSIGKATLAGTEYNPQTSGTTRHESLRGTLTVLHKPTGKNCVRTAKWEVKVEYDNSQTPWVITGKLSLL